jgi:hypothetical protein
MPLTVACSIHCDKMMYRYSSFDVWNFTLTEMLCNSMEQSFSSECNISLA